MESKAFKYMENAQSVTKNDLDTEGHMDETSTTLKYDEVFVYPTVDSTEVISYQNGFPPVYGLGFVLVVLTLLFLCYAIYHILKDTQDGQSEENIRRITLQNSPSTPIRTPSLRVNQETTPKRISPGISRFPSERPHLSSTPVSNFRRSSPESIETFEPWESYRFVHPDIPHEMIGPRGSTSESDILGRSSPESYILMTSTPDSDCMRRFTPESYILRTSTPDSNYMRRSSPESDILPLHERTIQIPSPFSDGISRTVSSSESDMLPLHERTIQIPTPFSDGITERTVSSSESDILPLHERTIQIPTPFSDGITRRTVSSPESAHWTSSDPDDVELRRYCIPKDS